ncbi:MAG: hypothetical protein GX089_11410 [Fibrobacter sp.]|jgi:hypothetical protein|nr:hypothetical protein [Fibrobacter sp.]HON10365.1 hypothetical protein [Chitinispirillaceae bacterium]
MVFNESLKDSNQDISDLTTNNSVMEKKLRERGITFDSDDKKDPLRYNRTLKMYMEFEQIDLPSNVVRSFFPPDYKFPSLEEMSRKELKEKVNDILQILEKNHVNIVLSDGVPDSIYYKYILDDVLDDTVPVSSESIQFITYIGCNGYCEECFQKDYCEIEEEEEEA